VGDVQATAGERTEVMATAGRSAAQATPDVQAHATRAAVDKTATAGGSGARAEATAETQAKAAKAAAPKTPAKATKPASTAAPKKAAKPADSDSESEEEKPAKKPAKAAPKAGTPNVTPSPMKPIAKPLSKSGLVSHLAEVASVEVKAVKAVLANLEATILASLGKKGARAFTWPGLLKATAVTVPAKPARKGINPFTKQEQTFAAKPASTRIRVRILKKAQDAVK
jgi:nucleoid DNA-binding protein